MPVCLSTRATLSIRKGCFAYRCTQDMGNQQRVCVWWGGFPQFLRVSVDASALDCFYLQNSSWRYQEGTGYLRPSSPESIGSSSLLVLMGREAQMGTLGGFCEAFCTQCHFHAVLLRICTSHPRLVHSVSHPEGIRALSFWQPPGQLCLANYGQL